MRRPLLCRLLSTVAILFACTACAHQTRAGGEAPASRAPAAATTPAADPSRNPMPAKEMNGGNHPVVLPPGDIAHERGIIAAIDGPLDARGRFARSSLLRREGLKYPLLRRVEDLQAMPSGEVRRLGLHEAAADHLLLTVRDPLARAGLARVLPPGCTIMRTIPGSPVVMVGIPTAAPTDYDAARTALAALPGVAHAGADWLVHAAVTPDDPSFAQQWALDNQGLDGATPDADIDAPEAWAWQTGSRTVKVGIVDTGIDLLHPDLAANLWTNPGEIPDNGIDDDGNGYIDDVHGWNFVAGSNDPQDDHYHGTHVAGTIGACGGNGVGVSGVCWNVTLVPLKFLDASGSGYTSDAVAAVYYATAIGCDLTNNSWGGGGYDQTLKDAIDDAGAHGRLFVAAAGNDGYDLDGITSYPASYACSNLVAVAATDHSDALAAFSNHGTAAVHLAAPGVAILSTLPTHQTSAMASRGLATGYGTLSGTSMAAPHVSGALALLRAEEPGLGAPALRARLLERCEARSSLIGQVAGGRRLNLRQLLDPAWSPAPAQVLLSAVTTSDAEGNGDGLANPGETLRLTPTFRNLGGVAATTVRISAVVDSGASILSGQSQSLPNLPNLAEATLAQPLRVAIPAAIADPTTLTVTWTATWSGGTALSVQRIMVASAMARSTVQLGYAIGSMTADAGRNRIYVVDKSGPMLLAVSTGLGRLVGRVPLPATMANSATWGDKGAVSADGSTLFLCDTAGKRVLSFALPDLALQATWQFDFAPVEIVQAANGLLYVSSTDPWGTIRQLSPIAGAELRTLQKPAGSGSFSAATMLRLDPTRQHLFTCENAWGYVYQYDVSGNALPPLVKAHPFLTANTCDFAVDMELNRIYTLNGGVYGIELTDMITGEYGQYWPFGAAYGVAVALPAGSPYVYGSSGGPYDSTIVRFRRSDGVETGRCDLSEGSGYCMAHAGLAATPNGRLLAVTNRWRGDGGGAYGYDWRLTLLGGGPLVLDNAPHAVATLTPSKGPPGLTVTGNASGSYDPDADGGVTAYHWDFGDGATADTTRVSHTYPVHGNYTVTLEVTDAEGLRDRKAFTVWVNGPPVPVAQSLTIAEDASTAITLSASDPDGDAVTYTIASPPTRGSLSGSPPNLTYTPYANLSGGDSFTFTASDGTESATAAVGITITPVNDPPTAADRTVLTRVGVPIVISIAATDPDSAQLSYQVLQLPAHGTLSGTAPNLTYTPDADWAGLDSLSFTASDGLLTSAIGTVTIRVNHPPVADPATVAVAVSVPIGFALTGSDADGQALTFRVTTNPVHGAISGTAPALTYTPNPGEVGSDSLAFVANDGYHDSAPATITFAISATNPWSEADLPLAGAGGSVAFIPIGSGFTVRGSGDLGPTADGGRFTWTTLPGDGLLAARATAAANGRGGLMLRSATAGDAACAALLVDAGGRLRLEVRAADGGELSGTDLGAWSAPCWLRLQRTPGRIEAARSGDGRTWTTIATAEVDLPLTALGGIWAGGDAGVARISVDQVRTHHTLNQTWQTLGGGPSRSGVVHGIFADAPFSLAWQTNAGGSLNPVAIGNGQIFVTRQIYMTTSSITALDLETGAERWSWPTAYAYSVNPPAFAEGRVFVQRGYHSSSQLLCFSAATGAQLWTAPFAAQWERYQAGCPAEGAIHVNGGTYGGMYGFDQVDGSQRYYTSLGQYDAWAPTYAGGTLYSWVAGQAGAHQPATGAMTWAVNCGWSWSGYSMNTVPVVSGQALALRGNGTLHLVDIATHARRWSVNETVTGTPAVTADTVYALADNRLIAYSLSDGTVVGGYTATGSLLDQPLVTDDSIIIASATSTWVLDRSTFALRQNLPFGGHPALVRRTLILADPSGTVRACIAPAINHPPLAVAQNLVGMEDHPLGHTLSGEDSEEDPLTYAVTTPPAHGSLVGRSPALTYVPQADFAGADSYAFTVNDGAFTSAPAIVSITVAAVNDRPSFLSGPDQVADGDGLPVTIPGWAHGFVPGPANEAGQTPTYTVTVDHPEFFANAPQVAADGTLAFTPARVAGGAASITVTCRDSGGTALGGIDTSLPATATITIRQAWDAELTHDQTAFVTLVASTPLANEAGAPGRIRLSRSGATTTDLVVALACTGSAEAGIDYQPIPAQVTIPAGQSAVDLAVLPLQDGLAEPDETVVVTILPGTGYYLADGTPQQATVTIVDDEPVTVDIVASGPTAAEPSSNGAFALRRSGSTTASLTVRIGTGGTATPGQDFQVLPVSVQIPAGEQSLPIPVTVIDDAVAEEAETVIVDLLPDPAYRIGTARAVVAIADNEPEAIGIEAVTAYAAEPGISGTFRVFRRGIVNAARTVSYTVGGTATPGSDYQTLRGSAVLVAGSNATLITVSPIDDNRAEDPETVVVKLATPAKASLINPKATMVLLDDDRAGLPVVSLLATTSIAREASADGAFTITRTGSTAATLRVLLKPATGSASPGSDYDPLPLQIEIPAGQAAVVVPLHILDDQAAEPRETVALALAPSPDYAVSAQCIGTVTIDDDETPSLVLAVTDATASEPGTNTGGWTLTRSGDLSLPLTVALAVDGSATAGQDYRALPSSITIPAGTASVVLPLVPLDDAEAETDESAILRLQPDPSYRLGGAAAGAVTIRDNEKPVIDLIAVDRFAAEDGDTGRFRILRRGRLADPISVGIAWSGTARPGSDIKSPATAVTLAANAASSDIVIVPKQDMDVEGMESLTGRLLPGSGYLLGTATATIWVGDDESSSLVSLVPSAASGYEFDALPAAIEVHRSGRLDTTIIVSYSVSGTAVVHELVPSRQVVLPSGVNSARIILTPLRDERAEGDETVILQLLPGAGYVLDGAHQATFTIHESPPGSG